MGESSGGADQACRGATPVDNSEDYYGLHLGVESLAACKDLCTGTAVCKGIEFQEQSGRCEIWTRAEGISATVPIQGYTCLRFKQWFEPVGNESGAACRGSDPGDNSAAHYTVHHHVDSLAACEGVCIAGSSTCKGIEYSAAQKRCEIWTRAEGIGAVLPVRGFSCRRLRRGFGPVAASGQATTAPPAAPAPATTERPSTPEPTLGTATHAVEYAVARGSTLIFSTERVQEIRVLELTPTTALVCSSSTKRRSSCSVLEMSDGTVKQGAKVKLGAHGETIRLSLARLSGSAALACYAEHRVSASGRPTPTLSCQVLAVAGTALTKGGAFVLDDGDEVILSLSLVGLSPTAALACYDRLYNDGLLGICRILTVSDTLLEKGQEVHLSAGDIDFGLEIVAARLSETSALVCYRDQERDERAACNTLSVSGGAPIRGPTLVFSDGHFHSLTAAGLSPSTAVVCYKDFAARPPQSICSALVASADGLVQVPGAVVPPGKPSVARLSDAAALVCSSDTHHTHRTSCAALALVGGELAVGPDLVLTATNTGSFYSAVGLSPTDALVCYEDREDASQHRGTCTALTVTALPDSL